MTLPVFLGLRGLLRSDVGSPQTIELWSVFTLTVNSQHAPVPCFRKQSYQPEFFSLAEIALVQDQPKPE
jgi:hypothetical protein